MTEISFSSSFKRAYKKKIKRQSEIEERFWAKIEIFVENSFERSLRTHKLSGKLKDLWSFCIEYTLNNIFSCMCITI